MPRQTRPRTEDHHPSSFLTLLSGWVQQGVESFFATQRILVDIAMRQNAIAMKNLREAISDPEHSPVAILTELAVEGTSSFMEAQRILLNLAQEENDLLFNGVRERVGAMAPAVAMTDLTRSTIDTFLAMQHEFLKVSSKQTLDWLEATKKGKYTGTHLVDMAREGVETFVHAQKKFLDVITQATNRLAGGKTEKMKPVKKTELTKLARDASNAFIDAQKKLLDVAGQQMNVNLKATLKTMELMTPMRLLPMANITGDGVKDFVKAEKALIDSMVRTRGTKETVERPKRTPRRKAAAAAA